MQYFLKLKENGFYEEVDEYTWQHARYALGLDGGERYSGGFIVGDTGEISFSTSNSLLTKRDIAIIARLANVRIECGRDLPVGTFCHKPQMVKFRKGKRIIIHETDGQTFKAMAA